MAESTDHQTAASPRKFAKLACDQCHRCKLRCSRELPKCERCRNTGSPCTFSAGKPLGKPRGSKNRHPRRRQRFDGEEQVASIRRRHNPDVAAFDTLLPNQSLLDEQSISPPLHSRRHDSIDWHSSLSPEWPAVVPDPLPDANFDGIGIDDNFHHEHQQQHQHHRQQQQQQQQQQQSPASDTAKPPPTTTNDACSRSPLNSLDSQLHSIFTAPAQPDNQYPPNLQTDLQPLRRFSEPDDASSSPLASSPCACGPTAISILSLLHQHQQAEPGQCGPTTTPPQRLDRSLALLRTSVLLCERSLSCAVCRANAESGMLLWLLLLNRAMWCYIELLSGRSSSSSFGGSETATAFQASEVVIGGLEVAEGGLRGRIIKAIIRAEMRKGILVLCMFERVLGEPEAGPEGERLFSASLGLGRKIGGLMGQVVKALREEFESWR